MESEKRGAILIKLVLFKHLFVILLTYSLLQKIPLFCDIIILFPSTKDPLKESTTSFSKTNP